MKTFTKRILPTFILITIISFTNAQTNVSGGIYSNTIWTKANSPYIVTDTVVVFPNVTLTIEPGVTVKFYDHKYIEIRQGTLNANGYASDSITFTSNSLMPTQGIWGSNSVGGIYLNIAKGCTFNFCHIEYATTGIANGNILYIKNSVFINNLSGLNSIYSTHIDSCIFKSNSAGIDYANGCIINLCNFSNNTNGVGELASSFMSNCTIDSNQTGLGGTALVSGSYFQNCIISYNITGMTDQGGGENTLKNCIIDYNSTQGLYLRGGGHITDSVISCEIKFNGIGLTTTSCGLTLQPPGTITQCVIENNATGIQVGGCSTIYCNRICNNTSYDLQNLLSTPISVSNNYWCTTDPAIISAHIYDGYDNVSLGLVTFMPVDSVCSPGALTSVNEITPVNSFRIYPNPATDYLTVELLSNSSKTTIKIFNMLGELEYSSTAARQKTTIDVSTLSSGIHIIEVAADDKSYWKKFIRQMN